MAQTSLLPAGKIISEGNQNPTIPITPIHTLSTPALLHRIAHWNGGSPEDTSQVLTAVIGAGDYLDHIKNLKGQGIDPQSYINSLDQVGPYSVLASQTLTQRLGDRSSGPFRFVRTYEDLASRY